MIQGPKPVHLGFVWAMPETPTLRGLPNHAAITLVSTSAIFPYHSLAHVEIPPLACQ